MELKKIGEEGNDNRQRLIQILLWPEKKLTNEHAVSGLLDYLPDMYMMKRFIGACLIGARAVSQDRFALRLALLSPDRPASGCITYKLQVECSLLISYDVRLGGVD